MARWLVSNQTPDLIPHPLHRGARADQLSQPVHSAASLLRSGNVRASFAVGRTGLEPGDGAFDGCRSPAWMARMICARGSGILKITPRTVAFHKYSMMEELGIKSSAELVRFAIKKRIVFP